MGELLAEINGLLGYPLTRYHLQRVFKAEQILHIFGGIAAFGQLFVHKLRSGNFTRQLHQLGGRFLPPLLLIPHHTAVQLFAQKRHHFLFRHLVCTSFFACYHIDTP